MLRHIWSDEDIRFVKRAYRNQSFVDLLNLSIPEELREGLDDLGGNMRFSDPVYCTPGLIIDNTKKHSLRIAYRFGIVSHIGSHDKYIESEGRLVGLKTGKGLDVEKGKRLLLRHDFVERYVEDVSSNAEEVDHDLARGTFAKEEEVARKIFDDKYFKLFQQFQIACRCLSGVSDEIPAVMEALVARLVDHIDSDAVFYDQFTKRLLNGYSWDGKVPPSSLFTNYMWWFNRVLYCFNKPEVSDEAREAGIFLIHDEARFILECWDEVQVESIPFSMKETLDFIRKRLSEREKVYP